MNKRQEINVYEEFLNHWDPQKLRQQVENVNEKDKNSIIIEFATGLLDQKNTLLISKNQEVELKVQMEILEQDKILLEEKYNTASKEITLLQKEILIQNTKKYSIDEYTQSNALLTQLGEEKQKMLLFYKQKLSDLSQLHEKQISVLNNRNNELFNKCMGVVTFQNQNILIDESFRNDLGGVIDIWQDLYQQSQDFIMKVQQITSIKTNNHQPKGNLKQLEELLPQIQNINEGIPKLLQLLQEKKNNSRDQQLNSYLEKVIFVMTYKQDVFRNLILLLNGIIYDQRELILKNEQLDQQKIQLNNVIRDESFNHEKKLKNINSQHDQIVAKLKQKIEQSQICTNYTQKEIKLFSCKGAEIQKQFYDSVKQSYQILLGIILENQLYFLLSATLSNPIKGQNENHKKITSQVQQLIQQMQPQSEIQIQDLFAKSIPNLFGIYKDYFFKNQGVQNQTLKQCFINSQALYEKLQQYKNLFQEQNNRAQKAFQELENVRSIKSE